MKMIKINNIPEDKIVNWGNGISYRYLTKSDNLPFSITKTIVYKNTSSKLQYINHIEACFCIKGRGWIETKNSKFEIVPNTIYIPEKDEHILSAEDEDMVLVCVFTPPLKGDEKHALSEGGYSTYN